MSFITEKPPPLNISDGDVKMVSIAFGWLLGFTFLTTVKAGTQTLAIWRRVGHVTLYIFMIWLEIITCTTFGLVCWLCMHGTIREGFVFFFLGTTLKCIIVQLIVQILVNRISILVTNPRLRTMLRWGLFTIVLILNIGVYCIWIPAHLEGSGSFFTVNVYYARCEKATYMLLDAALNYYFCSLVKSRLINAGIRKYESLYRFNLSIILVSMSLDTLLIGMMSYPNPLVYVQFYPVIFMAKLNIEMNMADMIAKVARSSNSDNAQDYRSQGEGSHGRDTERKNIVSVSSSQTADPTDLHMGSFPWKRGKAKNLGDEEPPCHNEFDWQRTPDNSLYHAWISGGMNSQTHLSREGIGQLRHNHSPEVNAGFGLASMDANKRNSVGVIKKDTIVDVRAEDMGSASTSKKGSVSNRVGVQNRWHV